MSHSPTQRKVAPGLLAAGDDKVRKPRQARSLVSFERMIAAAEALLVQRGSDNFTMTDVSRVSRVSIGSILPFRQQGRTDSLRSHAGDATLGAGSCQTHHAGTNPVAFAE